jgi:hypothetical protein
MVEINYPGDKCSRYSTHLTSDLEKMADGITLLK